MKMFDEEEFVATKMLSDITKMSSSAVRRYLTKFGRMNVIKSDEKNKGTKYYLAKD